METFRGFLRIAEPRAKQRSRQKTILARLATDAERVRAVGNIHGFLYTGETRKDEGEGGSGAKAANDEPIVV